LDPGCQHDYVLVLEGEQGHKKSSALRAWATDKFFADLNDSDLADKDAALSMHGVWIVELAELDVLSKTRRNATKKFVTRRVDRFRPPYGHNLVEMKRRSVLAGTTNDSQYLDDATGERRWWPVKVLRQIDVALIAQDADQLWAEAVVAYDAGERSWLTDDEERTLAKPEQADRQQDDPVAELLLRWIEEGGPFSGATRGRLIQTTASQALEALGLPSADPRSGQAQRVGRAFSRLGWEQKKVLVGETRVRVWVAPGVEPRRSLDAIRERRQ
jgi:predicted P-loop ATPase